MKRVLIVSLLLFMTLLAVKPEYFLASAGRGLALFSTGVLPALFPFFFSTKLLTMIGGAESISKVFEKPVNKLFGAPRAGAYAMLCSFLCGYPVGAATTADLYAADEIDDIGAIAMCSFCSTSGPLFILGTVGTAIFADTKIGVIILVSHYTSAIANGILFATIARIRKKHASVRNHSSCANDVCRINSSVVSGAKTFGLRQSGTKSSLHSPAMSDNTALDNKLGDAVFSSTIAMLTVGGYIVLANMIIDAFLLLPIQSLPSAAAAILFGAIEMTRGCLYASEVESCALSVALACSAISFGGASVVLQSAYFFGKCGITLPQLLTRKLCQSIISFILSYSIGTLVLFTDFMA